MLGNTKTININDRVKIGGREKLCIIAGPCVIENMDMLHATCSFLKSETEKAGFNYVFKTSYDKANRTSLDGYRGPGLEKGIKMIEEIKKTYHVPVLVDVHTEEQIEPLAAVADMIQIPAFLCRQTDFVQAVARSNRVINVKKGQFVAPGDVKYIAEKIIDAGNENITLTERGFAFGYNNMVFDPRALFIMRKTGFPIIFDATHSVQLPSSGGSSGGVRDLVLPYARSAYAMGIDGLFLEVHENPDRALCDGPNMLDFKLFKKLLAEINMMGTAFYEHI
ncbi:MAG: 3-deoxy-8-phosphooctulonate synthase [Candidatus Wallbacteria bacterium]